MNISVAKINSNNMLQSYKITKTA